MRVAIFCPTVSGFGGMETAIRNLMVGFEELGDSVHLFLFGGTADAAWLQGLAYTSFGSPRSSRYWRFVQYAYGPAKAILGWKPDVVICADVTSLRMAVLGRKLAGRRRLPLASWVHFPLARVRMKESLPEADLHLAISGTIASDLKAYLPQMADRVFTIYNAVDVSAAAVLPRPEKAEFIYIGRLTWDDQKRVNDLLLAASKLRGEWSLKIVGAPPKDRAEDEIRLRAYATELGLGDRVSWLGWQKDAWEAVGAATALVMPSDREGFPMVLIEALAHGVVVLSSDCESGPAEIVLPGENGGLFPVADTDRLAALMQNIVDAPLSLPPPEAVRETALRYAAPAIAQRAKDAFLHVLAEHKQTVPSR